MADRIKPVEAAKRLGVPPQRVYNLIKQGRIKTFANPSGKVALVDFGEVKIVMSQVKQRGPHKQKAKGGQGLPGGLRRGTIITSPRAPIKGAFSRPNGGSKSVRTVTDGTSNLVWLSDGTIETIWPTDSLRDALQSGRARIETPASLLGVIMYQWDHEGQAELAESLRQWAIENAVGFYPIETAHNLMAEEQGAEEAKPEHIEVEVELTDEGIDVAKAFEQAKARQGASA